MSQVYILRRKTNIPNEVAVKLPSSKSISNRLLILNALCKNPSEIGNLSDSDDTNVMVEALKGDLKHIDIGAAGTAMRFLTAYLTIQPGVHEITGSERMRKRPIGTLVNALRAALLIRHYRLTLFVREVGQPFVGRNRLVGEEPDNEVAILRTLADDVDDAGMDDVPDHAEIDGLSHCTSP